MRILEDPGTDAIFQHAPLPNELAGIPAGCGRRKPASMLPISMLIELPRTGERSYLHGADIFDALVGGTRAHRDIVLALRVASDCAIEVVDRAAADADVCGTFRHRPDGGEHRHLLVRRRDRPLSTQVAFDESALTADAAFGPDRAWLPAGSGAFTFMRRSIALCLRLLERDHRQDYWTIAEIACCVAPRDDSAIGVAVANRVGGRFWKMALAANGEHVGHVLLARGPPRR